LSEKGDMAIRRVRKDITLLREKRAIVIWRLGKDDVTVPMKRVTRLYCGHVKRFQQ